VADLHNRNAQTTLSPQGCGMKKMILLIWKVWHEVKLAYANRYAHHRLGS